MGEKLLSGVRVVEVAMFAPDATGMHLADLGAEVIKVEAPGIGDPARFLGVPYKGESPATRRWNRGKHSVTVDLRSAAGVEVFRDLVASSDAVIEGMRAGSLARRGVGYDDLLAVNPRLVFASISGWGSEGPYAALGSHGLAFDAFAGLANPRFVDGRPTRPLGHVWTGLEAGPLYAAFAITAAIVRARATGEPSFIEVSEADAAASWNQWRIAYEGAAGDWGAEPDDPEQREAVAALLVAAENAGQTGPKDLTAQSTRYQYYETSDGGYVLFMATETKFWKNFCDGVGRPDLFERWPGKTPLDHAYANRELRDEVTALFASRTRAEWVQFFIDHNIAGAPVYAAGETHLDPHFQARGLWLDPAVHGVRLVAPPVRVGGSIAVAAIAAPKAGQHQQQVLRDVLGYDAERIARLEDAGAFGPEEAS